MKYLLLTYHGIRRNPGRSVLIALQLLISFALLGLIQGVVTGIRATVTSIDADLLVVNSRERSSLLPIADLEKIESLKNVSTVAPQNGMTVTYGAGTSRLAIVATNPRSWLSIFRSQFSIATDALDVMEKTRTGVIITESVAKQYGWVKAQRITLRPALFGANSVHGLDFDVVGVIYSIGSRTDDTSFVIVNNDYFNNLIPTQYRDLVQAFYVRSTQVAQTATLAKGIDSTFANSSYETYTQSVRELAEGQLAFFGDLSSAVNVIGGASLFALFISIAALMMQSIFDRTSELAVLKAVGFSDRMLLGLILGESLLLCLIPAAVGLTVADGVLMLVSHYLPGISMPPQTVAIGLLISVGLAIAAGLPPAWRARNVEIASALAAV